MEYLALKFKTTSCDVRDMLIAVLDSEGFEGITEEDDMIIAYIPTGEYNTDELESMLAALNLEEEVTILEQQTIQQKNWNEEWEKNFDPIIVNKNCVIRAPFHDAFKGYDYRITIEPKMSFGTGHHETTKLMMQKLFQLNLKGKKTLDMGCGTGILAILATQLGASPVTAIDYDLWSYENTLENIKRNNTESIAVFHGGKEVIPNENFDIIIANINRNILEDQMDIYSKRLTKDGILLLSGILTDDYQYMETVLERNGFKMVEKESLNKWGRLTVQFL